MKEFIINKGKDSIDNNNIISVMNIVKGMNIRLHELGYNMAAGNTIYADMSEWIISSRYHEGLIILSSNVYSDCREIKVEVDTEKDSGFYEAVKGCFVERPCFNVGDIVYIKKDNSYPEESLQWEMQGRYFRVESVDSQFINVTYEDEEGYIHYPNFFPHTIEKKSPEDLVGEFVLYYDGIWILDRMTGYDFKKGKYCCAVRSHTNVIPYKGNENKLGTI